MENQVSTTGESQLTTQRIGAPQLFRQSGAESIFQLLRMRIIRGEFPPGVPMREVELAESLGVSRTPIREALRLLYGERLVTRQPTGGFAVASMDESEMREVCSVRAVLEGLAAREAAAKIDDAELDTLSSLIEQMEELKTDSTELAQVGSEFHRRIEVAADNSWLQTSLVQLRGHIDRYRQVSTAMAGRAEAAVKEHHLIYCALASRQADTAEQAMRAHINRGSQVALEAAFGRP